MNARARNFLCQRARQFSSRAAPRAANSSARQSCCCRRPPLWLQARAGEIRWPRLELQRAEDINQNSGAQKVTHKRGLNDALMNRGTPENPTQFGLAGGDLWSGGSPGAERFYWLDARSARRVYLVIGTFNDPEVASPSLFGAEGKIDRAAPFVFARGVFANACV